ncbi:hypothetical protein [Dactylosporangium sp. NPDC051541]|uniref:hypothetical protein n=1 Tax=Dactylosporangium sp. NPDC051541 TaxID=3363977 RepID=UPI0037B8A3AD
MAYATGRGDPHDNRIDNWATYGYPDGTVVHVAQSKFSGFGPHQNDNVLSPLPFNDTELAAVALDPAFHIRP